MIPKPHPPQEQVQPPAEVCNSWDGSVAIWQSWEASQRKEAARQREEKGASQVDGARQQENVAPRPGLHSAAKITTPRPKVLPRKTTKDLSLSQSPGQPFSQQPQSMLPRKKGLQALLCYARGQGDVSRLSSPACAKHQVSVFSLLDPPISYSSAVYLSRMAASSYQDWKPWLARLQNP